MSSGSGVFSQRAAECLTQGAVVLHRQYLHGASSRRRMASILTLSMPTSSLLSASNSSFNVEGWLDEAWQPR
ncbi:MULTISPECIES: hypothetical protein [unclassified Halomonas]|uniref:hypothetical protein n=1 Tax=unclassified Halomonas TaxID=2609666 RepID=UPI0028863300|nr:MULTISPECIES: hypothetical protein [unclassified Halomonas]MDT0592225.1 hypothetical protein [Halomonas sp. PAR8]